MDRKEDLERGQLLARLNSGQGYGSSHPETQDGEVFICYEVRSDTGNMDLPEKRSGTQAYDKDGIDLTAKAAPFDIVPVFANKEMHGRRYTMPA